ncbi:MAG: hypothetical protein U1E49_18060 [Hyphomicrobiaceae bacterium]
MTIAIHIVALEDLPFEPGSDETEETVSIESEPDEEALADGESDPFGWIDLRDLPNGLVRLIDGDEVVVKASEASLVISYPLAVNAVRLIKATNGKEFTRAELVALIDETYREIYRQEAETQSSPTPPVSERGQIVNRPVSDGTFGISMHDLDDLGIAGIDVYRIDGLVWLDPVMES